MDLSFVAFGAVALTLFLFTRDWRRHRLKWVLRQTPTTPVSEAREGAIVKVVGRLVYGERTLTAPVTERKCAYYTVVVENMGGRSSTEVHREEGGVDFLVRDATGTARVTIGKHVAAVVLDDREARESAVLYADEQLVRFLDERGIARKGMLLPKDLRAREGVLEADEQVAVIGVARWEADPAAGVGYRDVGRRLTLVGSEGAPLIVSDERGAVG